MSNYRVRVTSDFLNTSGAASRSRSGITVNNTDGYTGPLTSEQLKEIQEDRYLSVTKEDGSSVSKDDESLPAVAPSTEYEDAQAAENTPTTDELKEEIKESTDAAQTKSETKTETPKTNRSKK